ncbi:MAG: PEGA domain-containing protein, partial [Muribaculaceae bacterium]|nr:PEGA domain-containing protein [Muribaculaceae bacterium]
MKRIAVFLMLLMAVAAAKAQEAKVKRVEPSPMDLSASKYQRLDLNGKACALVRVEVLADDVEFFGDVVNPVEHKTGDYWVYMPGGSKMLQIKSRSFLPLFINFDDYGIKALQPMVTYVITLSLPAGAMQQQSATSGRNYLVMNVSPANAKVTVEGVEREVRDGKVKTLLRHGTYSYHVEAPGYLPEDGRVNVGSDRAELTVALRSTKGTLAVSTTTPGTEIYVNGDRMGAGSWSGEMFPDTYAIEGRLAGHRNAEQVVTVATGQTATLTLPALIPITGSLNIDYEPVGASISIDGTARGTT